MKFLSALLVAVLVLSAHAAPASKLLTASTKDLGATLVKIPHPVFRQGCGGRKPRKPRTTAPTTTRPAMTEATQPMTRAPRTGGTGGRPMPPAEASGPPAGTGQCVSCSARNFRKVNEYRVSEGLNRVGWSDELARLAEKWSKTMYDTKVFKHSDFPYWENIIYAYGYYTWTNVADEFFVEWKKSPGHDENMRLPSHKCVGVGIYGDGDLFYGTQIFSNDCP